VVVRGREERIGDDVRMERGGVDEKVERREVVMRDRVEDDVWVSVGDDICSVGRGIRRESVHLDDDGIADRRDGIRRGILVIRRR
jgi:hypothetical protein